MGSDSMAILLRRRRRAVVFVIDCKDIQRFDQAASLLSGLLNDERLAGVPFLVFGNKAEYDSAASESQLRSAFCTFHLTGTLTGKESRTRQLPPGARATELFMISVFRRQGFREGFAWLAQHIR
jgi:GTP-binding protein SAR1